MKVNSCGFSPGPLTVPMRISCMVMFFIPSSRRGKYAGFQKGAAGHREMMMPSVTCGALRWPFILRIFIVSGEGERASQQARLQPDITLIARDQVAQSFAHAAVAKGELHHPFGQRRAGEIAAVEAML